MRRKSLNFRNKLASLKSNGKKKNLCFTIEINSCSDQSSRSSDHSSIERTNHSAGHWKFSFNQDKHDRHRRNFGSRHVNETNFTIENFDSCGERTIRKIFVDRRLKRNVKKEFNRFHWFFISEILNTEREISVSADVSHGKCHEEIERLKTELETYRSKSLVAFKVKNFKVKSLFWLLISSSCDLIDKRSCCLLRFYWTFQRVNHEMENRFFIMNRPACDSIEITKNWSLHAVHNVSFDDFAEGHFDISCSSFSIDSSWNETVTGLVTHDKDLIEDSHTLKIRQRIMGSNCFYCWW